MTKARLKKKYIPYDSENIKFQKMQANSQWQKVCLWWPGDGMIWVGERLQRGMRKPLGARYITMLIVVMVSGVFINVCVCAQLLSCILLCNPADFSLPCSSVQGISQARIAGWGAIFSPRRSFQARDWNPGIDPSALAAGFFITVLPEKPVYKC